MYNYGKDKAIPTGILEVYNLSNRVSELKDENLIDSNILGYKNNCAGRNINVLGEGNRISSSDSNIIGRYNNTSGTNSNNIFIAGNSNVSSTGKKFYIIGDNNNVLDGNEAVKFITGVSNIIQYGAKNVSINGFSNIAEGGEYNNIEGYKNTLSGSTTRYCHVEGNNNILKDSTNTHVEGDKNDVTGSMGAHIGGTGNIVNESYDSDIAGVYNNVSNRDCFVRGRGNTVTGELNSVFGYYNSVSSYNCAVFGRYCKSTTEDVRDPVLAVGDALVVGNGSTAGILSNAFRVAYKGGVMATQGYTSSGADYAEFIYEWFDGNPDNEDRVGYFVTVRDQKLYKATSDNIITGITSGNPSIVGNGDEDYYHRWERDEFNRIIWEDITDEETGEVIPRARMKQSKNYDSSLQSSYVPRSERKEWDYVGMVGVIPVRDDGTCVVNSLCKCNDEGIATLTNVRGFDTFLVIERVNENVVKVIMK